MKKPKKKLLRSAHPVEEADDSFLDIDLYQLDKEWLGQPRLHKKYATEVADARLALDEAKAELEVAVAEMDMEIRSDPGEYGLGEKTTEAGIKNALTTQPSIQRLQKKVRLLAHDVSIRQAALGAVETRCKALENHVRLHGQQYFSVPRASDEDSRETTKEFEKQAARRRAARRGV